MVEPTQSGSNIKESREDEKGMPAKPHDQMIPSMSASRAWPEFR